MAKSKRKKSSSKPTKRLVCDNADKKSPIQQRGMNHAQLTLLIYFTFFMSRQMELSRAVANGPSTTYCSHKFLSLRKKKKQGEEQQQEKEDSTIFDDLNQRPDDSPAFDATIFGCDETDWKIVQVRHQTSSIRVVLTLITGLFCWKDTPLLTAWNMVFCLCPVLTSIVALYHLRDVLVATDLNGLAALLIIGFSSSRRGMKTPIHPGSGGNGFFNTVLYGLSVGIAALMSMHLTGEGIVRHIRGDGLVSEGGHGVWFMMVVVDYGFMLVLFTFALFFFDEIRKRAMLFILGIISLFHAFLQLPLQKDIWLDAAARQNVAVSMAVIMFVGALLPSFNKFTIKT